MKTVDQYIHKATRGLPRKERLDLAVQLRMHMHEKIQEYMAAGYPREEAKYLTLQDMGDPQVPFEQTLRHFLQYQLPWGVLIAALVWAYLQSQNHPAPVVKMTSLTSAEWVAVKNHPMFKDLNRFESFSAVLPAGSRAFEMVVFQKGQSI